MGMGMNDDAKSQASSIIEGPGTGNTGIRNQMARGALMTPANVPSAAGMAITTPQGAIVPKLNMEEPRANKHETSAKKDHRR